MDKKTYPIRILVVEREEGLDINGLEMAGTGIYQKDTETFEFCKTPKRTKSSAKNPPKYTGDFVSMRLNQNGSHRVTIMLHPNIIIDEVLNKIVKEVKECLSKL